MIQVTGISSQELKGFLIGHAGPLRNNGGQHDMLPL
jgi:hypothetical protein